MQPAAPGADTERESLHPFCSRLCSNRPVFCSTAHSFCPLCLSPSMLSPRFHTWRKTKCALRRPNRLPGESFFFYYSFILQHLHFHSSNLNISLFDRRYSKSDICPAEVPAQCLKCLTPPPQIVFNFTLLTGGDHQLDAATLLRGFLYCHYSSNNCVLAELQKLAFESGWSSSLCFSYTVFGKHVCVLKETVFLSRIPFWRQAQKESDTRLLLIDWLICCLNCYLCYRSMNYHTWLWGLVLWRHYEVSITLLPCLALFVFAEVCLPVSICEIDKNITRGRIMVLQAIFYQRHKKVVQIIFITRNMSSCETLQSCRACVHDL